MTLDLLTWEPKGSTYSPELDRERLQRQLRVVYELMIDGNWRTLREIEDATGEMGASISARLRSLRNDFHLTVDRRRRGGAARGIFEYRVSR